MISSAPSCLDSLLRLAHTRASAALNFALESSLTLVPSSAIAILLTSRPNLILLLSETAAAKRM
jgi:hypothetical protein